MPNLDVATYQDLVGGTFDLETNSVTRADGSTLQLPIPDVSSRVILYGNDDPELNLQRLTIVVQKVENRLCAIKVHAG
ncbi:hypothetical protein JK358_29240 [Nocardia sp. 2]|uniref:Uncharacterized protein n=1 Tax=Nocardia acididurans TaxID=2802282 RepID=A0ABS1MCZ8_9NOCA|nr:hypothetical protein [Nocardia acididurans]MBL1078497.1 hypothetical protein [Nocardia acididurans]